MLYNYMRLIRGDNGALTDVSLENQDETRNITLDLVTGEDYIYVAQHFPFNNLFFQVSSPNAVASTMSVEYWSGPGNGWKSFQDVLDDTKRSGASLATSGVIQFTPDPMYNWQAVGDSQGQDFPTGLTTLKIYNVYWLRISFNATLTNTTAIKRLSYAFTRSQQLDNLDVEINRFLTSFSASKTNWDDEIVTASQQVVDDLMRAGLIVSRGQVLRFDDVSMAASWKTLMLIYRNCGPAFRDKLLDAEKEYGKLLNLRRFSFDKNQDGFVDKKEISNTVARLTR
jgi:hypothetical protein